MSDWYVLKGKVPVKSSIEKAAGLSAASRRVALTEFDDGSYVSTVFLGLDHSFDGSKILFETMVFGGPLHQEMERYRTWEEAEAGHKRWVAAIAGAVVALAKKSRAME